MTELKIIAVIEVKDSYKNELIDVFKKVVDETRKEVGNISYDLHQDVKNPLKFVILETWKSKEAIDAHNVSDHFKAFTEAVEGKVDSLTVDVIKSIY